MHQVIFMKEKNIKIFMYNVNDFLGGFDINEHTIPMLRDFAVESLSDESLPYLELVYDIQSEDGETYNIKFEPYQFDMANKAIQNKFILKDIFDGVDLKTANMIGEMAYAFAEYVSAILYALSDENNSSRYLKQ